MKRTNKPSSPTKKELEQLVEKLQSAIAEKEMELANANRRARTLYYPNGQTKMVDTEDEAINLRKKQAEEYITQAADRLRAVKWQDRAEWLLSLLIEAKAQKAPIAWGDVFKLTEDKWAVACATKET